MGKYLACFKAYDVRGKVPTEPNPEIAYAVGRAYADLNKPQTFCNAHDIRPNGPDLDPVLGGGPPAGRTRCTPVGGKGWPWS